MFITTQQGFFIRTRPHGLCQLHHKVISSAPVRTVAQVEKHYTRAYNLFRVKPLQSHCGHLLKFLVTCSRLEIQALLWWYIPFSLSLFFKCLCLQCKAFSGHFHWV